MCSHFSSAEGKIIRLFTLYLGTGQAGKQSGYQAVTIAIHGGRISVRELAKELPKLLAGKSWKPASQFPSLRAFAPPLVQASSEAEHRAFIWLGDNMGPEELMEAFWQDTFFLYQRVYASTGKQTFAQVDRSQVDVFGDQKESIVEAEVVAPPPVAETYLSSKWESTLPSPDRWQKIPWLRRWLVR